MDNALKICKSIMEWNRLAFGGGQERTDLWAHVPDFPYITQANDKRLVEQIVRKKPKLASILNEIYHPPYQNISAGDQDVYVVVF